MGNNIPSMVDMAFDLKGSIVPENYAYALRDEVVRFLPCVAEEKLAGILPLRGSISEEGMLLARRSKLVLRLPAGLVQQSMALSGQRLSIGFSVLHIGEGRERPLQPYPTLHAHIVEGAEDEEIFMADVVARLTGMGVNCKWICGKRHWISGNDQLLGGYSLVLHDLKPEASLLIQRAGLGNGRDLGCGIFVPYKDISGLD